MGRTLLEHGPDVFRSGLVVQVLCGEFEGVEEAFYVVYGLLLEDFYTAFHVDLRELVERSVGMNVVVENNDPDHDPHTEQERVLAAEPARVLRRL